MEPTPQQPSTKLTLKERLAAVKQAREAEPSTQATSTEEAKSVEPMEPANAPVQEQPKTDRKLTLKEKLAEAKARRGQATIPQPTGDPQLPLPMEPKQPAKPPTAMQGGVSASKKDIKVPAYVRRYMDMDDRGEPVLYITQSPNQKTGVNISRHKAKIKRSLLLEEREKWKKAGQEWDDISDEVKEDIKKSVSRKADKLINSWIDEQQGTDTVWIKGDPNYAENDLVDRAKSSMLWRAWAPIEATLFPSTVEVIEKSDIGKTYSQENKITTLERLGRIAPSTVIFTAIKAGGYGNEEHLKELQAGKEAMSYIPEIGDYITDTAENLGLISEETSNNWWINTAIGSGLTIPIILTEPDIATAVIAGAGFLAGGPAGAAGGFLASRGAKGLKAIKPIAALNKTANRANKFKANLAEVAGKTAREKAAVAKQVIRDSQKSSFGTVLKETTSSRLATGKTNKNLDDQVSAQLDAMQEARKAAPSTISEIEKLDLDKLAAKAEGKTPKGGISEFNKLRELTEGNELEALKYVQSKATADALLARELQKRKVYAEGLSQFKPKLATADEYKGVTSKLRSKYDELADLEKSINKKGITDGDLAKRAKLIDEIQGEQKALAKLNAQSGLEVAVKRAEIAQKAADKSRRMAEVLTQVAVKSARMGDEAFSKGVKEANASYTKHKNWLARSAQQADNEILYDTVVGALDDILESTNSLKKNLGVKTKKYNVPELQEKVSDLYDTNVDFKDVNKLFDETFGEGAFAEFVANNGSSALKSANAGSDLVRVTPEMYDELQIAMKSLVDSGVQSQKRELGIELAEQVLENSDFINYFTNISGVNWVSRSMARMAEIGRDFADPARKAFGSTSKAVVKAGRSMDSFFKRSTNEIADVLSERIDKVDDATRAAYIDDLAKETVEYAKEGGLETPLIRELLRQLKMSDEGSLIKRKEAVVNFMRSPDEKLYDKIVAGAMKQQNLKKLMTTTEPLTIQGRRQTMSNVGKTSWWETSKSWWIRNIAEETGEKSLDAFVVSFLGKGRKEAEAQKYLNLGKAAVKKQLRKNPDASYQDIEKAVIGAMTRGGQDSVPLDLTARGLGFRATAVANAASQERAVFDMIRRVGGVTEETAQSYVAFKGADGAVEAKAFSGLLDLLQKYNLPISRETYRRAKEDVSTTLKLVGKLSGEGQRAFIPTGMIKTAASSLDNITKQLIQYDPTGDVAMKMATNNLTGLASLWKTSLVTGLILPNPGHWTNIFFGNFSQMWGEVGFKTATRVSAQTLTDFVPFFGKKVDEMLARSQKKFGEDTTLGSTFNTVLNPHLSAFFNRAVAKDSDKLVGAGAKYAKTWGELREIAVQEGVLSTFIGTDIRKALSTRMSENLSKSNFPKSKQILKDILTGEPYKNFAETVEQRQRVALFMDLVMRKGMNPRQAADNVKKALYDWDSPLSDWEAKYLNNVFLFWRFWKLSLGQAGRHLMDPFVKPLEKPTDLIAYSMLQKSPLSRGIAQGRIASAAPELAFDKLKSDMEQQLESGEVTPEEYYLFLLSIKYPHWKQGGNKVFLANYPIDSQISEQYEKLKGYAPTHEAVTMPGLTTLDTYNMLLSMLTGLSATAVTAGRAGFGEGDVSATDAIQTAVKTITNPALEMANPLTKPAIERIEEFFLGARAEYRAPYVRLKPSEKALLEKLNAAGFLNNSAKRKDKDPEGVVRMNRMAVDIFRATPFLGTQMSRLYDPFLEAGERQGYTEGLMHILRQLTGLGKVYAHDPEYTISRSISDIGERASEMGQESKYESIVKEEDVEIEDE
tara:strand:- start:4146 stop:9506 length:5361 start_codon:yes stop_codon:yes gene_type:complete